MARFIGGTIGIVIGLLVLTVFFGMRFMPSCREDQVLLGTGEFNDGRWTRYECGPQLTISPHVSDIQLQACGEAWYHTMAALDEALVRLEND